VTGYVVENDGRPWRLTLRDGLRFHDGEPERARDFFGLALMQATDEVSAADDRTLVFRLNKRFSLLPDALAKPASSMCPIMPERLALTDPFRQVTEMVGSGPYRFLPDERISGARVVYAKNAAYVPAPGRASFTAGAKVPILDRIEWNVIPDPATAAAALLAGAADWWEQPTVDQIPMRLSRRARGDADRHRHGDHRGHERGGGGRASPCRPRGFRCSSTSPRADARPVCRPFPQLPPHSLRCMVRFSIGPVMGREADATWRLPAAGGRCTTRREPRWLKVQRCCTKLSRSNEKRSGA